VANAELKTKQTRASVEKLLIFSDMDNGNVR
jgi:hypothetical protein